MAAPTRSMAPAATTPSTPTCRTPTSTRHPTARSRTSKEGPAATGSVLGKAGGTARGGDDTDDLEVPPATGPAVLRGEEGANQNLVAAVKDVDVDGGGGGDDIYFRLTPSSRGVSVNGGGSWDLAILDVRKAGFGKGSTITVDLGSGVLRTKVRAGGVRALEVMAIIGKDERWKLRGTNRSEDLLMQEDAAWRP